MKAKLSLLFDWLVKWGKSRRHACLIGGNLGDVKGSMKRSGRLEDEDERKEELV